MRLLTLHMKGFGKFKDKTLDLKDGLNVVYGLNETGKSTIHAFIEGMFYGFIDGTKKRRTFTDEHEKYRPREGAYQGALEFEFKGKAYRLERNFDKKNTDVRLFEKRTGRDITDDHPVHPVRKEIDLARFLDMPRTLFKNTLSIAQMNAETDESARSELLRRLQNISQTKSETLSISKALNTLDDEEKEIGSDRAPTRPYLQTKNRLDELRDEYEAAKAAHDETLEEKRRLDTLAEDDRHLEKELAQYESELKRIENSKRLKRYRAIEDRLNDIKKALEKTADTPPGVSVRFLERAFDDYGALFDSLESDREALLDKFSRLDALHDRLPAPGSKLEQTPLETIEQDASRFKTFTRDKAGAEEEISALEHDVAVNKETLEIMNGQRASLKRLAVFGLPALTVAALSGALVPFFMLDNPYYLFVLLAPILASFIIPVLKRKTSRIDTLRATLEKSEKALERANKTLDMNKAEITRLLRAYGIQKEDAFEAFYHDARYKKQAQSERQSLLRTLEDLRDTYKPLLSRFNLPTDTDRLKGAFNALRTIHTAYGEIRRLLDGEDFDSFEASVDFQAKPGDLSREDALQSAIREVRETLHENALERSRKEEIVASKEKNHRPLSTIDYEIAQTEAKLSGLEKEKRILEKATSRLKNVQKTIEDQFAPVMNENTEAYLKVLTKGTYDSIKMKKDLSFNVLSKATGRLESERFFSAGTLDQIYIAMRLGILKTLKKDEFPLFMDDPFVQFDKARLEEALKLLNSVSKERQVILFTCHEREAATLDTLGTPYEHHTLS